MLYTNFVGTPTLLISIDEERSIIVPDADEERSIIVPDADEERSIIVPDAAAVLIQIVIIFAEYDIKYLFTNSL